VIRGIISIFLLTLVSSVTIAFLLGSSPTFFHAAIASSFTTQKGPASSTSVFKITDEIKDRLNALVDSNRTKAAIVIGIVDPNGTQFYNNGKISSTNNTNVDQNTIFAIGSNTKVFTKVLLAEMVEDGLIKLNDPMDKYLPSNVTIPQFKGHKITIEDLATHTSGLPEFPSNYCPSFAISNAQSLEDKVQHVRNLMSCTKNFTIGQLYQSLSNTTLTRPRFKI